MKTFLTVAAVVAAAGFAFNAGATTQTAPAVPTTDAVKPSAAAAPVVPAMPTATTTAAASGTSTTTIVKPTTPAATPMTAVVTEAAFTGQITSLNAAAKTCKVKDATGKEWNFSLGTVVAEGVKVGDNVEGKFDPKTNTLISWRKKM